MYILAIFLLLIGAFMVGFSEATWAEFLGIIIVYIGGGIQGLSTKAPWKGKSNEN